MLRVLFILLALVSALVALAIDNLILYAVAGALLLVALMLVIASVRRRRQKAKAAARPVPPENELASLGITDIRPRTREHAPSDAGAPPAAPPAAPPPAGPKPPPPASVDAEPAPQPEAAPETSEPEPVPVGEPEEPAPAPAASGVYTNGSGSAPEEPAAEPVLDPELLRPALTALRLATDAITACLLRQDEASSTRYHIEGVASRSHYVQSRGSFSTRQPLVMAGRDAKPVTLIPIGEGGLPIKSLGYYVERMVVRQAAVAPVPCDPAHGTFFLLADSPIEDGLRAHAPVLADFARLLATMIDPPASEEAVEAVAEERPAIRPRRDIIQEEMQKARAADRPLALALVVLNRHEEIMEEGEAATADTEQAMERRLRSAADGARVERFGDLTFGVFYGGDRLDEWAPRLEELMAAEGGPLKGGVSVGAALMGDRHTSPDSLRADATEALTAAYASGACTILE